MLDADAKSAHAASSMPEPKQSPLIRAITGTGHVRTASHMRWVRVADDSAAAWSNPVISARSVPATNDFSPAPVITTARSDPSWRRPVISSMK